jgi:octaprenyl-diphosphate synthase
LATLVHDDVMDEAQLRRNRPTLAANWGNEISVLLGDCLFAHALSLAASFPTPEVCRSVALATNTVCSGEILQTHQRRKFDLKREDYFKAVEMETGELFALSCDLGSWLAGANPAARFALREYGLALGTAYQIYDDCLDLFGSEDIAGKSLGTDLASGKLTLPLLIALEKGSMSEQTRLKKLIQSWDPKNMSAIFELLCGCHALTESCRVINQYLEKTRDVLEPLPKSDSLSALLALSDFLAQQIEGLGV